MKYIVKREDGSVVNPGDEIIDFRGDKWAFISVTRESRIYVDDKSGGPLAKREFFPTVFKVSIEEA